MLKIITTPQFENCFFKFGRHKDDTNDIKKPRQHDCAIIYQRLSEVKNSNVINIIVLTNDRVNHEMLMDEMDNIGIRNLILNLFRIYFRHRVHKVPYWAQ